MQSANFRIVPLPTEVAAASRRKAKAGAPDHAVAYNGRNDMIDAVILENDEPEAIVARLPEIPETAFLEARSSTRGCYTFRIERS